MQNYLKKTSPSVQAQPARPGKINWLHTEGILHLNSQCFWFHKCTCCQSVEPRSPSSNIQQTWYILEFHPRSSTSTNLGLRLNGVCFPNPRRMEEYSDAVEAPTSHGGHWCSMPRTTFKLPEGLMIQECETHSRPMISPLLMGMKWLMYFCIFICLFTGEDAWRLRITSPWLWLSEKSQE